MGVFSRHQEAQGGEEYGVQTKLNMSKNRFGGEGITFALSAWFFERC